MRNGFKDVFTNNVGASRVLTYDDIESTEKHQNLVQTRADVEEHKDTTLERKLKIGNKKSDKFFGESLSDHLSDEHIDEPIKASKDEVDRSSTSEKKLFFLMNMLDSDQEEILKYSGIQPVEEPMFVAKKKEIKRHICDDDDHMHAKFHDHEKETCDHVVPPPKPDRDFSKYIETSIEIAPEKVERVSAQARTRRQISRESLPTPPDTPKRRSGASSLPGTPTITIENIDFNTPNDNEKLEKIEEVKKIEAKKVESNKVIDNQKENGELVAKAKKFVTLLLCLAIKI